MKNIRCKILLLITMIITFITFTESVKAVSLYNKGGVTGYEYDGSNAYTCPGITQKVGVIRIQDASSNDFYCIQCNKFFPNHEWSGSQTAYTYNANGTCKYTCSNINSSDYGMIQHTIWNNYSNYSTISCNPSDEELASKCNGGNVYILKEYEYSASTNMQDVVEIIEMTPETKKKYNLTLEKKCEGGVSGSFDVTVIGPGTNKTVTLTCGTKKTIYNLIEGEYKVTEKTTGNFLTKVSIDYGALINDNSHMLNLFEDTTITFTNYKEEEKYQLTLYKECKNITEGTFNFTVTGPSNYKKDLTLSCQGKEVLTDLVKGSYTITENETGNYITSVSLAKDGTYENKNFYTLNLTKNVEVYFKNEKVENPIKIKFIKVDQNNKPLTGAVLSVLVDDKLKQEIKISKEEGVLVAFEEGTFRIVEKTAPEGYSKDLIDFILNVTIDDDDKLNVALKEAKENVTVTYNKDEDIYEVKIRNDKYITIAKKDSESKKVVEGAKLTIKDKDGNVVKTFITTKDPYKLVLKAGEYTLYEEAAPKGYAKLDKVLKFTVLEDGTIVTDNKELAFSIDNLEITVYNNKPVEVPDTGVTRVLLSVIGLGALGTGLYIIYKSFKNNKKESINR